MKKLFIALMLAAAIGANAQTPTTTTPQSVTSTIFTAVTAAQTSGCITNLGQTQHLLFYTVTGTPSAIQVHLEGSFNSDSATCTTGTWQTISDDATNISGAEVVAIGTYPFLRANLVACAGCGGAVNLTAFYTGTSAIAGSPFGFYGAGQQIRKVVFASLSTDSNSISSNLSTPYGSTAGFLAVNAPNGFAATSSISVRIVEFGGTGIAVNLFTLPTAGVTLLLIPIPATSGQNLTVFYHSGGVKGATFNVSYYFFPPGSSTPPTAQPANTNNSEASAVAATASVSLTPLVSSAQRAHVFHINAHCSAGTAQLLVVDTTTSVNLWSSAATEVGTSTFSPPPWNPGLAGLPGDTVQVQLTTCGVANTGTLDVQGSVF